MTRWEDLSKVEQYAVEYSDIYKETYGMRPRGDTSDWDEARWEKELASLYESHSVEIDREAEAQQAAFERFLNSINTTMKLVSNCTPSRAVEILADAEGIRAEQIEWYGYEVLEFELGMKFGTIKKWLNAQEN